MLDAPERVDDLLGDAVAEELVLGVGAHVRERQDGDCLVPRRRRRADGDTRFVVSAHRLQLASQLVGGLVALIGIADANDGPLSPTNGRHPAISSYITTPSEKMSVLVDDLGLELLRRHVGERAHRRAVLGQRRAECGLERVTHPDELCETEVEHLDATRSGDHHVGRFEVAMGNPFVVGGGERVGQGHTHLEEAAK